MGSPRVPNAAGGRRDNEGLKLEYLQKQVEMRVLGAHGADLRDPKDNVQVVAKLSDSRGDVAYNDFVKMCLQAPRA